MRLDAPALAEPKGLQARNLMSLKEEQKALSDTNTRLADDNASLKERYTSLKRQCQEALRDKGDLADEVRRLRNAVDETGANARAEAKGVADAARGAERGLRGELERVRERLRDAEGDLEAKLTNSRQFVDLKGQLRKKNALVADLRDQLKRAGVTDGLADDDQVRR